MTERLDNLILVDVLDAPIGTAYSFSAKRCR